jgi:hypothetical protein
MKSTIAAGNGARRFVAVYGFDDPRRLTQKLTEPRESVEAIMADLADKQEREGKPCLVRIVDLSLLEPVESCQATLERLRRAGLI